MFVDLPGSLEDQQDPVHLCHPGHPGSDRRDSIDVNACPLASKKCVGIVSLKSNS